MRQDIIDKELESDKKLGFYYDKINLTTEFINKLFQEYYVEEFCEFWYDSEPDIEDYISDLSYMYDHCTEDDLNNISGNRHYTRDYILKEYGKEYNKQEAKIASEFVKAEYEKYMKSDRRLTFNNWIDINSEGVWGMSQKQVCKNSKDVLINFLSNKINKDGRVYISYKENDARLYVYGRDELYIDYWFTFKRKHQQYYKTTTNSGYLIGELFDLNELIR